MSPLDTDPWPWEPPSHGVGAYLRRHRGALILLVSLGGLVLVVFGVLALAGRDGEPASDLALPTGTGTPSLVERSASPPDTTRGDGGMLSVSSFPTGAMVLLDSKLVGTTPLSLGDLASGTYTVTVAEQGYAIRDTLVTVAPEQLVSLLLTLQTRSAPTALSGEVPSAASSGALLTPPALAPPTSTELGTLSVLVRPWGTILIDGAVAARETDVRHEAAVTAGPHRVRAVHPVLGSREVEVVVGAGATAAVEIDFHEQDRPKP